MVIYGDTQTIKRFCHGLDSSARLLGTATLGDVMVVRCRGARAGPRAALRAGCGEQRGAASVRHARVAARGVARGARAGARPPGVRRRQSPPITAYLET